jgi:hypothetical protein
MLVLNFFRLPKAKNLTLVEISFETLKLFENTENNFHIKGFLKIMFHE